MTVAQTGTPSGARPTLPPLPPSLEALARYRGNHWDFLTKCAKTIDQTDRWQPIKPFCLPGAPEASYLQYVTTKIVEEPLLVLVKHRRMRITWGVCGTFLWDAMFHEGRFNALLSKKEEDSDDLIRRCKFIYDNIPEDILKIKPICEYKYTELRFPEIDSKIKGFAQGADQLRQYTCSRIGADEIAFWPQARATFVAMKPTLEGGGRVCLFSTRWPGFFQELVEDRLDYEATLVA